MLKGGEDEERIMLRIHSKHGDRVFFFCYILCNVSLLALGVRKNGNNHMLKGGEEESYEDTQNTGQVGR